MKAQITLVELKSIRVPSKRKRALNEVVVKRLMESFGEVGQLNPILLRSGGVLVAGRHRHEAAKRLKMEFIRAQLLPDADELRQELVEIDENLIRAELTELERGEHLLRRKEIYEALHPQTGHGGHRSSGSTLPLENGAKRPKSFAEDTAEKTGQSARTVRGAVQVADKIDPAAKKKLAGTKAAKSQRELLRVSREKPSRQKAIADLMASGEVETVAEAREKLGADPHDTAPSDSVGQLIPPDLCEPWSAVESAVAAIDKHLIAAKREWTELEKKHDGTKSALVARFIAEGRALMKGLGMDEGLKGFSGRVRELAPYAVCGNCGGSGECPGKTCRRVRRAGAGAGTCNCSNGICAACKSTGVLTRRDKLAADHEAGK